MIRIVGRLPPRPIDVRDIEGEPYGNLRELSEQFTAFGEHLTRMAKFDEATTAYALALFVDELRKRG